MKQRADLVGQIFGRWLVTALQEVRPKGSYWMCRCTCGAERSVRGTALTAGLSTSCGCYRTEVQSQRATTHGQTNSSLYHIWCGLKARCLKASDPAFKNYGARGITVCKRWLSFESFAADVGPRPEGMQLERKKNWLGYSPGNCVWRTAKENSRNKRNNRVVTYQEKRMPLVAACELSGLSYHAVWHRLSKGWPTAKLFSPIRRRA